MTVTKKQLGSSNAYVLSYTTPETGLYMRELVSYQTRVLRVCYYCDNISVNVCGDTFFASATTRRHVSRFCRAFLCGWNVDYQTLKSCYYGCFAPNGVNVTVCEAL